MGTTEDELRKAFMLSPLSAVRMAQDEITTIRAQRDRAVELLRRVVLAWNVSDELNELEAEDFDRWQKAFNKLADIIENDIRALLAEIDGDSHD